MKKANSLYFYVDRGILRCRLQSGDKVVNLNRDEAKDFLRDIDNEEHEIRIKNNKIVLTNKLDEISIDISDDIFESEYKFLVRKTYKRVRKIQREYMREKYKGKEVQKTLVRGTLISAGPLAGILMAMALNHPQSEAVNVIKEPIPIESIRTEETIPEVLASPEIATNIDVLPIEEVYEVEEEQRELPNYHNVNQIDSGMVIEYNNGSVDPSMTLNDHYDNYGGLDVYTSDVSLPIEDLSQDEKAIAIRNKYWDAAKKSEAKWGIDARVLLAILNQESGGLLELLDIQNQESHNKDINLMQITYSEFEDKPITVYNFETEEYLRVVFTNTPEKFIGKVNMTISEKELNNPITQLGAAGLIMNYNNLNDYNEFLNPCAMIDEYNKGLTLFLKVLDAAPHSRVEILSNPNDLTFMNYESAVVDQNGNPLGDYQYVEHVLRYVDQTDGPLIMKTFDKDENGNKYPVVVEFTVNKTLSLDSANAKKM